MEVEFDCCIELEKKKKKMANIAFKVNQLVTSSRGRSITHTRDTDRKLYLHNTPIRAIPS